MAWNEPGGSGGKNPWGNGSGQGPPDLDDIIRNLQQRFSKIFGGQGASTGGGAASGGVGGGLALIAIIALIVWAIAGIYIVDEGRRGVVLQFGAYHKTTMPGPHWHPRFIQSVEVVDVSGIRTTELGYRADEALMLTQDENIIDIKFAIQYQVKDARHYLFNVRDPDETLFQALESAVREVIGKSKMDFVITGGRSEVVSRSQEVLQQILDQYATGLHVTSLNMQDAQPPAQVQAAFDDAVKAREDEERLKNEAQAYANDVIPKARGAAARMVEEANAYREKVIAEAEGETSRFLKVLAEYEKAPEVTGKRLYLDSIESVLSNSSKVLIDTEGGNNLLYLPLDRLMNRDTQSNRSALEGNLLNDIGQNQQRPPQPRREDMRGRSNR